jgi:hypothetical protein
MEVAFVSGAGPGWLVPAPELVARATAVLGLAALGVAAARRGGAARRHLVLSSALAGLLLLPVLTLVLPVWEIPFLRLPALAAGSSAGTPGGAHSPHGTVLVLLWGGGSLLVALRYAAGVLAVRRAARGARAARGGWIAALGRAREELGVPQGVRLLHAPGAPMPMTWGIARPVILLPPGAEAWDGERRRAVLLHELAHVGRRDCLWQGIASLCCAVYWFHPGVWWAARRMRVEREHAADDRVLEAGIRPSNYARHLVEVARSSWGRAAPPGVVALARRSGLEERVLAVLERARPRGRAGGRGTAVVAAIAVAALVSLATGRPAVVADGGREAPRPDAVPQPGEGDVTAAPPPAVAATRQAPEEPRPAAPVRPPARGSAPGAALRLPEPREVPLPPVLAVAPAAPGEESGAERPAPSAGSPPLRGRPAAARAAPSAPVDAGVPVLVGLSDDTTYVYQPPPAHR